MLLIEEPNETECFHKYFRLVARCTISYFSNKLKKKVLLKYFLSSFIDTIHMVTPYNHIISR